jgi:hypothetical protein
MRIGDLSTVLDQIRFLTHYYQYRVEPWQLISALGSGVRASDRFTNTIWQKYIQRHLRLWNGAASGVPLVWNDTLGRWVFPPGDKQKDGIAPAFNIRGVKGLHGKDHHRQPIFQPNVEEFAESSGESDEDDMQEDPITTKQTLRAALFPGYRPDKPAIPKKRAIVLEFLYGQALAAARSWQGAIGKKRIM